MVPFKFYDFHFFRGYVYANFRLRSSLTVSCCWLKLDSVQLCQCFGVVCDLLARNVNLLRSAHDLVRSSVEAGPSPAGDMYDDPSSAWHRQAMDFVAACNKLVICTASSVADL